ncbi:MAG: thioredoxin family protein [Smithellaceae bacterium]|nr:thioredoxin family protein [Smithellaceae bacterium]MDD3258858.1 thioredoxin family protein [Smithellaceae bacterium]MDD3848143.1 thioredoxin family protein [Smithellaceae bacterium]HOG12833.1 thioredoxin family protein [Smithellaceae bacterium]HPL09356.1 thioredoxin family protein [Smithellaceae bacterium]
MDVERCASVDNLQDLDQALLADDRVIAMVYATWCPFCRKVLPVFEKWALKEKRRLLLVADDDERAADVYDIDIFPTLILFEKGRIVKRLDGRPGVGLSEKQIADFIKSCPPAEPG